MIAKPLPTPLLKPTFSKSNPIFMITHANGLTKIVVHKPSYSSNGLNVSHAGSLSISTLFSLYSSITFSSVGLHNTFSVSAFPVSSYFTAFLFSSVRVLVQPVNITKLNIIKMISIIF